MSEAKFTKGPWSLKETPSGMEIQAGGGWLFLLDDGRKPTDAGSDFLETQDANLNVMLAATELYEALEQSLQYIPESEWVITTHVRKVLAKARGEA